MSPSRKRAAAKQLQSQFDVSERRACKAIDQPRSTQRYTCRPRSDEAPLVRRMCELFAMRGVPQFIRSDNGPEFTAQAIQRWLRQVNVATLFIEPGSPWQNGFAESFHSRLRDEFLAIEEFESLATARKLTAMWKEDYNTVRPHSSLGYLSPGDLRGPVCCFRSGYALTPAAHRNSPTLTFISSGARI